MRGLPRYLNPIAHLGDKTRPLLFPLFITSSASVILEAYAYGIARNPHAIDLWAIFVFMGLIIYFSFRVGIIGGIISSIITICYYFYIIYTRHYSGAQLASGLYTTLLLGLIYIAIATTIGWLKQTIDKLLEREADEKRRLETIIQQLPVGVLITDSHGKLTRENKQVEKILGAKFPQDFTVGKDSLLRGKANGKDVLPSQAPITQVLTTGRAIIDKEYTIEKRDGKQKFLQVSASVIRNKQGKIIAAAEIINDITQQKELELRKDDFVNMASHELKTPITSMKLYIELLTKMIHKYDDPRAIRTISQIKRQTERLQELVNDLLDVSRLQTGKLSFQREEFPIHDLIVETIDGVGGMGKQQKIRYTKSPITVYADRFRIYQVLTNLVTNASKYSPRESAISIGVKRSDGKVVVSVQDHGIGISKEQQKKIFDRLYQVTDPEEKTFPGIGMGLYISKEIVKRHKGNIWVESEKGKGSTFFFSLPARKS